MAVYLNRSAWLFVFLSIIPFIGYSQSFSRAIAPKFSWHSEHHANLPLHPFDTLLTTKFNRKNHWAMGMPWQKPFAQFQSKNFYIEPIVQNTHFNTVQGWESSLIAYKNFPGNLVLKASINYGFTDQVLRPTIGIWKTLSRQSSLFASIGNKINQFNNSPAIVPRANTIGSLFFEDNFAKLYESNFFYFDYLFSKNIKKATLTIKNTLLLARNNALKNKSSQYFFNDQEDSYFSNNPIFPRDYTQNAFNNFNQISHEINVQFSSISGTNNAHKQSALLGLRTALPFNISSPLAPVVLLEAKKFSAANILAYENLLKPYAPYIMIVLQHKQLIEFNKIGHLSSFIQFGSFIKEKDIPFTDFKHFNGNQTKVVRGEYTEVFNLLPYYEMSTDSSFTQWHIEHNFKGFLLDKIPLIKKLDWESIISLKRLMRSGKIPYTEVAFGIGNIGFTNNKILRLEYVQSYFGSQYSKGFTVGLIF